MANGSVVVHEKNTARLLFRPRSIRPQIDILFPEETSVGTCQSSSILTPARGTVLSQRLDRDFSLPCRGPASGRRPDASALVPPCQAGRRCRGPAHWLRVSWLVLGNDVSYGVPAPLHELTAVPKQRHAQPLASTPTRRSRLHGPTCGRPTRGASPRPPSWYTLTEYSRPSGSRHRVVRR